MPATTTIHCDPEILGGTPVFAGTRVRSNLIDYIERNHSIDEFLDSFPTVSREQVMAALEAAHDAEQQPLDECSRLGRLPNGVSRFRAATVMERTSCAHEFAATSH